MRNSAERFETSRLFPCCALHSNNATTIITRGYVQQAQSNLTLPSNIGKGICSIERGSSTFRPLLTLLFCFRVARAAYSGGVL